MNRTLVISLGISFLIGAILTLFPPAASAGPPLVCWPFEIGGARSLPWGGAGWHDALPSYDLSRLPGDTLALLSPELPVLARMETLRRAAVYSGKDSRAAQELLVRLQERAAAGPNDALAQFDLGYFVEAYRQMAVAGRLADPVFNLDGHALIRKALALRDSDAEMEFAAALALAGRSDRQEVDAHWRKAVAGAKEGSLLARNLVTHGHLVGQTAGTLAELRARAGLQGNN